MALRSEFRAQIGHLDDGPMWVNGKTADLAKKNQIETGCAWAVPGGIPSAWGQFGAVKMLFLFIAGLRRQLNAL